MRYLQRGAGYPPPMAPVLAYLLLTYAVAAVPFALVVTTLHGGEQDVTN